MKIFKYIKNYLLSYYYFLREKCSPSSIKDGKEVPIIINNFNRLTTLRLLIEALNKRGYDNIYIIDNASTYPPLRKFPILG